MQPFRRYVDPEKVELAARIFRMAYANLQSPLIGWHAELVKNLHAFSQRPRIEVMQTLRQPEIPGMAARVYESVLKKLVANRNSNATQFQAAKEFFRTSKNIALRLAGDQRVREQLRFDVPAAKHVEDLIHAVLDSTWIFPLPADEAEYLQASTSTMGGWRTARTAPLQELRISVPAGAAAPAELFDTHSPRSNPETPAPQEHAISDLRGRSETFPPTVRQPRAGSFVAHRSRSASDPASPTAASGIKQTGFGLF